MVLESNRTLIKVVVFKYLDKSASSLSEVPSFILPQKSSGECHLLVKSFVRSGLPWF